MRSCSLIQRPRPHPIRHEPNPPDAEVCIMEIVILAGATLPFKAMEALPLTSGTIRTPIVNAGVAFKFIVLAIVINL